MGQERNDEDCGLHFEVDCGTYFLSLISARLSFFFGHFESMRMAPYIVFKPLLHDP